MTVPPVGGIVPPAAGVELANDQTTGTVRFNVTAADASVSPLLAIVLKVATVECVPALAVVVVRGVKVTVRAYAEALFAGKVLMVLGEPAVKLACETTLVKLASVVYVHE